MLSQLLVLALPLLATATPLAAPLTTRQVNNSVTASLVQYLASDACEFTSLTNTLPEGFCIDVGSQENDGSISWGNLQGVAPGLTCWAEVYEYAGCGVTGNPPGNFFRQGPIGGDTAEPVCFPKPTWADGTAAIGSTIFNCQ